MVERRAFLQITKAIILGLQDSLTDPSVNLKQSIMEELARTLGVARCVLFKVTREEVDGSKKEFCKIIAGVPPEEYASEPSRKEPLEAHPDVAAAVKNGGTFLIKDPRTDDRTAYFRGMVEKKNIAQILYLPLFAEQGGEAVGVTVIDAIQERAFDDDEILFCSEVAELISLLIGQERAILQHFRDEIINRVVPLSCFAKRLRESMQTTLGYIEIIHEEAEEIDKILPKAVEEIL